MSWGVGAIRIFHSEGFAILRLLINNVTTLLSSASQLSLGCEWLFLPYSLFIHIICMNPWKKMVINSTQAILYENPMSKCTSPAALCQPWIIHSSQIEWWGAIPCCLLWSYLFIFPSTSVPTCMTSFSVTQQSFGDSALFAFYLNQQLY